MRLESREHTRHWMLSRNRAVVRRGTLIVNFPGNPKAIGEAGRGDRRSAAARAAADRRRARRPLTIRGSGSALRRWRAAPRRRRRARGAPRAARRTRSRRRPAARASIRSRSARHPSSARAPPRNRRSGREAPPGPRRRPGGSPRRLRSRRARGRSARGGAPTPVANRSESKASRASSKPRPRSIAISAGRLSSAQTPASACRTTSGTPGRTKLAQRSARRASAGPGSSASATSDGPQPACETRTAARLGAGSTIRTTLASARSGSIVSPQRRHGASPVATWSSTAAICSSLSSSRTCGATARRQVAVWASGRRSSVAAMTATAAAAAIGAATSSHESRLGSKSG